MICPVTGAPVKRLPVLRGVSCRDGFGAGGGACGAGARRPSHDHGNRRRCAMTVPSSPSVSTTGGHHEHTCPGRHQHELMLDAASRTRHRLLVRQFSPEGMREAVLALEMHADRREVSCVRNDGDVHRQRLVSTVGERTEREVHADDAGESCRPTRPQPCSRRQAAAGLGSRPA